MALQMSAYDVIDITRFVNDNLYTYLVKQISNKASLKYTLEKEISRSGAFQALIRTFDLSKQLTDVQLMDLEERLS